MMSICSECSREEYPLVKISFVGKDGLVTVGETKLCLLCAKRILDKAKIEASILSALLREGVDVHCAESMLKAREEFIANTTKAG